MTHLRLHKKTDPVLRAVQPARCLGRERHWRVRVRVAAYRGRVCAARRPPWASLRMIVAMVLGPEVLSPFRTFDVVVLLGGIRLRGIPRGSTTLRPTEGPRRQLCAICLAPHTMISILYPRSALHTHPEPAQRVLGVAELAPDSSELAQLLTDDPAPQVRVAAARRCANLATLAAAWETETDLAVRDG